MTVKFLFFAQCADWVQKKELDVFVDQNKTVHQMLESIPTMKPILERESFLKVAINHDLKDFETEVQDGDEIAFMPPYSGG